MFNNFSSSLALASYFVDVCGEAAPPEASTKKLAGAKELEKLFNIRCQRWWRQILRFCVHALIYEGGNPLRGHSFCIFM